MKFRLATVAWSVIYLLLLLSLLTPLRIFTVFLLIVPGVVLFSSLPFKGFLIHVIPVLLIIALQDVYLLLPAIYFLIPALLMGRVYKKGSTCFSGVDDRNGCDFSRVVGCIAHRYVYLRV
ncbi:hypothetical protein [Paenibacillus sp. RC343]|uniref:hypothetical protein n=1 Tax=Paenibacillus sp. RC343 TaxID=3045841 RepID=UPI0024BBE34A|nr:hypothetical protein [Paenibacillus sp. RC343]